MLMDRFLPRPRAAHTAAATERLLRDERQEAEHRAATLPGEGGLERVLSVEDLDVQRHRVGHAADVAGHDRDRAELPIARALQRMTP